MFTSFNVFLDACVLVPNWLRDILLTAAERELYRPLWSETVLDEMERALVNKRNLTSERARYTRQMMETAFPDAAVLGFEGLSPSMPINAKDQHVLAAALVGHAQLLVTDNSKDFPASILSTFRINVQTADEFLMDLLARYPDEILASLQFMAENTGKAGKPELTLYDCVRLIGATAPNFAGGALIRFDIT